MTTKIYSDETETVPILTQMKLPRYVILEILSSMAGERANVRDGFDPPSATGYETWRWGTRFLREHEVLGKSGWQVCERDQVSGIFNSALNIKLTVLPTDNSTGTSKSPRNVTIKGPSTCNLIDHNSGQGKFSFIKSEPPPPALWCLCTYFCDLYIAAEISRPSMQVGGVVRDYSDRIVVAKPFEIPGIRKRHSVPEDYAEVARPIVKRKS
jgi:hypothetical protein